MQISGNIGNFEARLHRAQSQADLDYYKTEGDGYVAAATQDGTYAAKYNTFRKWGKEYAKRSYSINKVDVPPSLWPFINSSGGSPGNSADSICGKGRAW